MDITGNLSNGYSSLSIPSWDTTCRTVKKHTFTFASYLTDPVCNFDADKICLDERVFTQLFPSDGSIENELSNTLRRISIAFSMTINLILTPFTAPLGIFLRFLGTNFSEEPFIYETTDLPPKALPNDRSFTLDSWNVLLVPGENSILHGGAPQANSIYTPSSDERAAQGMPYFGLDWLFSWFLPEDECTTRLDSIIGKIRDSDADVVCLYEGFDFSAVEKIKRCVQDQFHCMVSNIAPRSIGTNSGVVILSKFQIPVDSLLVDPFPKEYQSPNGDTIYLGSSGFSEKSLVKFSIVDNNSSNEPITIADIFPMHLQHSSSPDPRYVTDNEKIIREQQLNRLFSQMNQQASKRESKLDNRAIIACGDFNLDPTELNEHPFLKAEHPNHIPLKGNIGDMITWGGDASCAPIEGIPISDPQQLDYVLARSNTVESISTEAINHGNYDPNIMSWEYCSDHYLLRTKVQLSSVA